MLGHFVIPISIWIFSMSSASGEDLLLSVRQTDDVVVHLPPSSKSNTSNTSKSNTSTIYMVIALHGMGPNYPDLFQHEVAWDSLADSTGEFVVVYPLGSVCIGGSGCVGTLGMEEVAVSQLRTILPFSTMSLMLSSKNFHIFQKRQWLLASQLEG